MASAGEGDDPLRSPIVVPEALLPGPADRAALAVVLAEFWFEPAAGGGITGTLAASEDGDTAAISGQVIVQGALAASEVGDTAALAGQVIVQGALAASESGDTFAASGTVLVQGAMAASEGSDTFAATGFDPDATPPSSPLVGFVANVGTLMGRR